MDRGDYAIPEAPSKSSLYFWRQRASTENARVRYSRSKSFGPRGTHIRSAPSSRSPQWVEPNPFPSPSLSPQYIHHPPLLALSVIGQGVPSTWFLREAPLALMTEAEAFESSDTYDVIAPVCLSQTLLSRWLFYVSLRQGYRQEEEEGGGQEEVRCLNVTQWQPHVALSASCEGASLKTRVQSGSRRG